MTATILDTITGQRNSLNGIPSWQWADGQYTCDCNRNLFDESEPECKCERYLIVAASFDSGEIEYTLEELNSDYPREMLDRYLPNNPRGTNDHTES